MPAPALDEFRADLLLVQSAVRLGVSSQRAKAHDSHWERWCTFCHNHHLDPYLQDHTDPVPVIQVYAQRYRDGRLAPSGQPVKSRTVEDVIRAIAQKQTSLGGRDPRLNAHGKIDYRLSRQLRSYTLDDTPPVRVKPIPITIILHILRTAYHHAAPSVAAQRIADIITVAFFFLLRPGEYTGTTTTDHPFHIDDVRLHLGTRILDAFTAPLAEVEAATSASYTFTRQKNGVGNETLSQGRSTHDLCCPVKATICILRYHRTQQTPRNQPIASYVYRHRLTRITAADVTTTVKSAATSLYPLTGLSAAEVSGRSLRAGGAMALLCANVDPNTIKLLGRWHSDAMVRYLHVQAQPITQRLSARMFNNGRYTFLPTDTVPTV